MSAKPMAMRDVFIEALTERMQEEDRVFFLSADFGSPKLDRLRELHPDRFINVGIAEQNLINVATGLALEGYAVYAYAIIPFITMRCYEQVRLNLSMLSQLRPVNVNLIGVGAGYSYSMSGPSHHAFEDLTIMRALPNLEVFSPADAVSATTYLDYTLSQKRPKYLRFDAQPLASVYADSQSLSIDQGFGQLQEGEEVCLVATGYMTHKALAVAERLAECQITIGVIDLFALGRFDSVQLADQLATYRHIISIEEGFIGKGGLDALVSALLREHDLSSSHLAMGLDSRYVFKSGSRDGLLAGNGVGEDRIESEVLSLLNEKTASTMKGEST